MPVTGSDLLRELKVCRNEPNERLSVAPADYDVHFEASIGASGAFEDTAMTVAHPDRTIVNSAGTW